eukprot:2497373-Pyramimonas_sp.AAC.1
MPQEALRGNTTLYEASGTAKRPPGRSRRPPLGGPSTACRGPSPGYRCWMGRWGHFSVAAAGERASSVKGRAGYART